jgi:hypothetical protein
MIWPHGNSGGHNNRLVGDLNRWCKSHAQECRCYSNAKNTFRKTPMNSLEILA